jgi:hypothetical protein
MAEIATFGTEEQARRALSWLQRCHVRGAEVQVAQRGHTVTVPDREAARAADLLAGLDRLRLGTAAMRRPPLRERLFHVESLGLVITVVLLGAIVVGALLVAFVYVHILGVVGAAVVGACGLVWIWFNGFSAANPDPEALEHHHGPLTQELGVTHAYRRAWIRHTWRLTNRRRGVGSADRDPD